MRTGVARRTSDQVVRAFIAIEIGDAARVSFGGAFTARHVSLFQSTLTCGGAQYERIGKYSLE